MDKYTCLFTNSYFAVCWDNLAAFSPHLIADGISYTKAVTKPFKHTYNNCMVTENSTYTHISLHLHTNHHIYHFIKSHRNQLTSEDQLEADMTYQTKEEDTDLESFEREEQRIVQEMEEVSYIYYHVIIQSIF